ncbi:hypothetical protein BsWGS_12044 [Bradybaena similaris]
MLRTPAVEPTLTCANALCNIGNECHHVVACRNCTIGPHCIPVGVVKKDIDFGCRRLSYTDAILLGSPRNRYNQLRCSATQRCPRGSDCVGGLCCLGRVSVPITKPGQCPKPRSPKCVKIQCSNDYYCQGKQKCCGTCGKVCTDPINEVVENRSTCEGTRCPQGEVCVLRTPPCPPGRACIQVELPVCVPRQCANCASNEYCQQSSYGYQCSKTSPCGVCAAGQVCVPAPKQCFTTPCPQFECVPIDPCGGCRVGQVCQPNTCVTSPCPSYKCYPATD